LTLKAQRPLPYPQNPATLGDHLKKRRIEASLYQRQVAVEIGVTLNTILDWEKDRKEPETRYWPGILKFLGYDPHPEPRSLGERLRAKYRVLGLPRKAAAQRLGIDEGTLQRYEEGTRRPTSPQARRLTARFLGE
jgi:transcriptional regulator with XRE-family HTH domain